MLSCQQPIIIVIINNIVIQSLSLSIDMKAHFIEYPHMIYRK